MEDILEEIEDNPEYIILDKIELLRSVLCSCIPCPEDNTTWIPILNDIGHERVTAKMLNLIEQL